MSKIYNLLNLKDYITLVGTSLGIIALILGIVGGRSFVSLGFFLITIALGFDLLDGYVARKTNTVNEIGKELDSLSDSLTFGVVPAMLTYQAFNTGGWYDIVLIFGSILFALAGILRLARFNISTIGGYTGLPTPLSAFLLINYFYANYFYAFAMGGGGLSGLMYPFPIIWYYFTPFYLMMIGWFNITTYMSFKEKDKLVYIVFLVVAPACPILGIIGLLNPNFILSITVSFFFVCSVIIELAYICYGFYWNFKKERRE